MFQNNLVHMRLVIYAQEIVSNNRDKTHKKFDFVYKQRTIQDKFSENSLCKEFLKSLKTVEMML